MFAMKNITVGTTASLGAAIKARRLELGWSQAKLAEYLDVQRQWVIRLEAGSDGAEVGTVLKALRALDLSVVIGNEPVGATRQVAPTADLDQVFARLTARDPPGLADQRRSRQSRGKRR